MSSEDPPYRTNRTRESPEKWPKWGARFIEEYRKTRCVEDACEAIDVARSWVYECHGKYPDFGRAWDDVEGGIVDRIQANGVNLSIDGRVEEIKDDDGAVIGKRRKDFPGLIMFMLQALRPEMFRRLKDDAGDANQTSPQEIAAAIHDLLARMRGTVPTEPTPPAPTEPPASTPPESAS